MTARSVFLLLSFPLMDGLRREGGNGSERSQKKVHKAYNFSDYFAPVVLFFTLHVHAHGYVTLKTTD